MVYLELLAGLVILVVGGDALVRGAVGVARAFNVSPLLIGLTLVGFGTSTPELVTSVEAALQGSPGIAVGNVVGSNIANILLIIGISALIYPLVASRQALFRDGTVMVLATLACIGIIVHGELGRFVGWVLLVCLMAYVGGTYVHEKRVTTDPSAALHTAEADAAGPVPSRLWLSAGLVALGLIGVVLGARFLVSAAIALAAAAGVSETLVGLTIVAVGTSLPELVTSAMAAVRRQPDVALGNVIGSNIYNILGILGITAILQPLAVPPDVAAIDVATMAGATLLLMVFAVTGWRIDRREGAVLIACYGAYIAFLVLNALPPA